jgi:hypothetical protein
MLSDKNGNLILVGTPQIRIPEKMFFLAKNGQVREAPTTTKTGALSMRGGVRSINLIPDGDKVEIVKLGETLEEFRKRQSKKESEDFIKKVNETKINKKLDMGNMPELPEPKKEKLYLDEILKIKKNFKELIDSEISKNNYSIQQLKDEYYKVIKKIKNIIKEMKIDGFNIDEENSKLVKSTIIYMNIINKIESIRKNKKVDSKPKVNEIINEWDSPTLPILLSQQDPETYNNIEKKVIQKNKKNEYVLIGELAFFIKKYVDDLFKHYGENKEAVRIIIDGLTNIVEYMGAENVSQRGYDGLLKWLNASNAQKVYKLYNGINSSFQFKK